MLRRLAVLSLVVFVCNANAAHAEGVVIDHKAVGCIVVGKYPKMNACFSPAAELARSRVYFRPEGASGWYYVEMKADEACFAGTLPKPGKKLVGKKIEYYVEAQNKTFEAARTAEFGPVVVKSAKDCKKDVPVAPFLNNATVAVFPSLPAGFVGAGALGTTAIVGIAAAGAAVAGTAVAVTSSSNDATTTTTVAGVVVNTTTTTLTPTSTTTTTLPKANNKAPFAVLTTNPDPPSGPGPLTVTFDLCKSTDPDGDPLSFFFDFGDGAKASGSCIESHTYSATFRAASAVRAQDRSYSAQGCVVDTGELSACRTRSVDATSPAPSCAAPSVAITMPTSGQCFTNPNLSVSATATNASSVLFLSDEIDCGDFSTIAADEASTQVSGPGPTYSTTFKVGVIGSKDCYRIKARAFSSCSSATANAAPVEPITVDTTITMCGTSSLSKDDRAAARWSSDLSVDKGQLQMTINGGAVSYADRGRSYGASALAEGENRIEATLVAGDGKPGLWRFDVVDGPAVGHIRVLAGDAVSVTGSAVTFRLQGTPGERVAFVLVRK
jgi:hypothetical protein